MHYLMKLECFGGKAEQIARDTKDAELLRLNAGVDMAQEACVFIYISNLIVPITYAPGCWLHLHATKPG